MFLQQVCVCTVPTLFLGDSVFFQGNFNKKESWGVNRAKKGKESVRPEVDFMGVLQKWPTMKGKWDGRHEIGTDDSVEGRELEAESEIPVTAESQDNFQGVDSEYTTATEAPSVNRPTQSLSWNRFQDYCVIPQGS